MPSYTPTSRTTLRRLPVRGAYDPHVVHAILDEALVCHLGFAVDGQPFVIPTTFVRDGETLYVHAAAAGRTRKALAAGTPVCLTVTLVDGIVYALSAFHHSMNYRSVVALGEAREVTHPGEKRRALTLLVEKISPGRAALVRGPNEIELRTTAVLALPLVEVSAKVRRGPPVEDASDLGAPVWSGVVPLSYGTGVPEPVADALAFPPPAPPRAFAPR